MDSDFDDTEEESDEEDKVRNNLLFVPVSKRVSLRELLHVELLCRNLSLGVLLVHR